MEQATIRAWGNSQGIILPKKVLRQLDLKLSDVLDIEIKGDSITLTKSFRHKTFEERLAEYNGEISVLDYEWGKPTGKEML